MLGAALAFAAALQLAPCKIAEAPARCGTFQVPETRRQLSLKVIVLPATDHNVSPVFLFNGGPGVPTTPGAELEVKFFADERRLHDTVFVDERGTGGSSPIDCVTAMKAHDRELVEDDLFPPEFVTDCRRELEPTADLTQYTFDHFVDDIESLRKALGYKKIDIVAISAGTRAALTFLAKYPSSVRSMLLSGPVPPQNAIPLHFAEDASGATERLAKDAGGSFAQELASTRAWLGTHVMDVTSGGYTIHLSEGAFDEFLRSKMYTAEGQASVPYIVHLAATGEWDKIAPLFIAYRKGFYENVGVFLSITCPTDVRYIKSDEVHDYRTARQVAACALWTPGLAPRVTVKPAKVPVLIFSGELDPVTPPKWATMLAHDLGSNARVVTFANSGHAEFNECTNKLESEFFDAGSFKRLDDSCARTLKRPPFATSLP